MLGLNRNGWIGVDLGACAIKIAQLRRVGDGLSLTATAICLRDQWPDSPLSDDLRAAKALAENLRGSRSAATLSMSACQIDPTIDDEPLPASDRCSDQWTAGSDSSYTLSTPAEAIDSAVKEMSRSGLRCDAIDGPPLAIARVLQLTPGYRADELLLALDWGETSATLVAAKGGLALYTRCLNESDFSATKERLAGSLGLSVSDTDRLLARSDSLAGSERKLLSDAFHESIQPVAKEIKRSLDHLGGKLRTKPPRRCLVMGAGGSVAGLPQELGKLIGIPTEAWTASGLERDESTDGIPDCLLAQAIALSALAWEAAH